MLKKQKLFSSLYHEELEQRLLLSAGAEVLLVQDAVLDNHLLLDNYSNAQILTSANSASFMAEKSDVSLPREIIFVDSQVDGYEQLVEEVSSQNNQRILEIIVLDNQTDTITQISQTLAHYQDIDAIHFVTHGDAGTVQLGNTNLGLSNLSQFSDDIETWGQALAEDADLLFYGCELAIDEDGKLFIQQLSELTGADVAASTDLTGNSNNKNADWDLEHHQGEIETATLFTHQLQARWSGTLALAASDATVSINENTANSTAVTTVGISGAIDGDFQKIYWVEDGGDTIKYADIDGGNIGTVLGNAALNNVKYIEVDYENDHIYYTEDGSKIKRVDTDGNNITTIVDGLTTPMGIAIDIDNGKVYWSDQGTDKIQRADIGGLNQNVTDIVTGINSARGIAIDGDNDKIYWVDDADEMLQRADASLLNSNIEDLATFPVDEGVPNKFDTTHGVDLDLENGKVYWNENGKIYRGDLTGANQELLHDSGGRMRDITLDVATGKMYFTNDGGTDDIFVANMDGTGVPTKVTNLTALDTPVGIDLGSPTPPDFAITAGNTNSAFAINSTTGKITVNDVNELNHEVTGQYTLTVTVTNGIYSDTATITININDVNEFDPVVNNQTFNIDENSANGSSVNTVAASDSDTSQTLTYAITAGNTNNVFAINSSTGEITINDVTELDHETTDQYNLTVQVTDSLATTRSDTATITVDVNDVNELPTASNNTVSVNEDNTYTFTVADFNFSDVDDSNTLNQIKITVLETQGSLQLNGVDVTVNDVISVADINASNLTFAPASNANGLAYDNFQFQVNDGSAYSSSAYTMTIDVTAVNDIPTAANNTVTTNEDTSYIFSVTDFGFSDIDSGNSLSQIKITSLESQGSLQLNGVDVTVNDVISVADINASNLTFAPTSNANGLAYDNFQFQVNDGTAYSSTAYTMTIDVTAVSDLPTAADNTVTTNEDTSYAFNVSDFGFSDVDTSDSLTQIKITSLESQGSLQLNGADVALNDVISVADITAGKLIFSPVANANGLAYDNFQFSVFDGNAYSINPYSMYIDVTPIADAPTASDNNVFLDEDTTYVFNISDFGFSDVDGDALSNIQIATVASNGSLQLNGVNVSTNDVVSLSEINAGLLTFTPEQDANGASYDNFAYKVSDSSLQSEANYIVTINVNSVADSPTDINVSVLTVDENIDTSSGYTLGVLSTVDMDSGEIFSYEIIGGADAAHFIIGGEANDQLLLSDGVLDYEQQQTYEIKVRVTDNEGNVREKSFIIEVNNFSEPEIDNILDSDNLNDTFNAIDNTNINPVVVNPIISQTDNTSTQVETALVTETVSDTNNTTQSQSENSETDKEKKQTEEKDVFADERDQSGINDITRNNEDSDYNQQTYAKNSYASNSYTLASSASEIYTLSANSSNESIRDFLLSKLDGSSTSTFNSSHFTNSAEAKASFNNTLDLLKKQLAQNSEDSSQEAIIVGTVKSSGFLLAAGIGSWVLRGSSILGSVLSSLPAWNAFDPLPILAGENESEEDQNTDEVDDMFTNKPNKTKTS